MPLLAFLKLKFQSQRLIPLIQTLSKELSPFRTNILESRCLAMLKPEQWSQTDRKSDIFFDNFPLNEIMHC